MHVILSNYGDHNKELDKYVSFGLTLLSSLDKFYNKATVSVNVKIFGSYFTEKLVFENGKFRTIPFNEVIQLISKYNNNLEAPKKEPEALFPKNSRMVDKAGLFTNQLYLGFKKLYELKPALVEAGLLCETDVVNYSIAGL